MPRGVLPCAGTFRGEGISGAVFALNKLLKGLICKPKTARSRVFSAKIPTACMLRASFVQAFLASAFFHKLFCNPSFYWE